MSCPHGNGPASRCSQCLNAPVHRVEQVGPSLTVDGAPVRPVVLGDVPAKQYYQRGGRHSGNHPRTRKT